MTMTAEQRAQLRADIERRNTLPAFGPDTSIERIKIINDTQRSFTPEVVEALLDELERKDKRIAELKFVCESADQVQREYAEALGCAGDNESILVAIDEIKSRIAELEARTVTVSFTPIPMCELGNKSDGAKHPYMFGAGYNSAVVHCGSELQQACARAGVTLNLTVEG